MAKPHPTGKKTNKSAATRQRIINAARAEFGDKGIDCATTRCIAERAECNEVTLFRHFESKQKLLTAVVQDTSGEFNELCQSPTDMSGDLKKDLIRYATVYNNSLEHCEGMARALIGEGRRRPMLIKELIGDILTPFHQSLGCYLRKQSEAGRVRKDLDVESFAELFTAALMGGMLRRTGGLSQLKRDAWIKGLVDVWVGGIASTT